MSASSELSPLAYANVVQKSGVAYELYSQGQYYYALVTLREIPEEHMREQDKMTMMMCLFNIAAYTKAYSVASSILQEQNNDVAQIIQIQCCLMTGQKELAESHIGLLSEVPSEVSVVYEEIKQSTKEGIKPWIAAIGGHTDILEEYLKTVTDIDEGFQSGRLGPGTPNLLLLAVLNNQISVVELLLKHKINIEYTNYTFNALHLCILLDHFDILRLLVTHGANINATPNNLNAAQFCVMMNRPNIIPYLHAKNAVFNTSMPILPYMGVTEEVKTIPNSTRVSAPHLKADVLAYACVKGYHETVDALLQCPDVFNVNHQFSESHNATYLHLACGRGAVGELCHVNVVKVLLKHKANVTLTTTQGYTPLHFACRTQDVQSVEVIKLLLEHGADPTLNTETKETPMLIALCSGSANGVRGLLLYAHDKVRVTDHDVELRQPIISWLVISEMTSTLATVCEMYRKQGKAAELTELVNVKSRQDKKNKDITALHWACLKGNFIAVQLLILAGATITSEAIINGKRMTPLQCSRVYGVGRAMGTQKEDMQDCEEILLNALKQLAKDVASKKKNTNATTTPTTTS